MPKARIPSAAAAPVNPPSAASSRPDAPSRRRPRKRPGGGRGDRRRGPPAARWRHRRERRRRRGGRSSWRGAEAPIEVEGDDEIDQAERSGARRAQCGRHRRAAPGGERAEAADRAGARRAQGSRRGRTRNQPSVKIIAAITLTSRKGASNEIAPPTIPPSAGPPIAPRLLAASAKPIASPLRPGRARSETRARAATQLSVEPTPWTERPISNGGRRAGDGDQDRAEAGQDEAAEQQWPPPDPIREAADRQRDDQDRNRVGGERQAEGLVAGPGPALDLGQQRSDHAQQRGLQGDRGDRHRQGGSARPLRAGSGRGHPPTVLPLALVAEVRRVGGGVAVVAGRPACRW